jgi:hypothetical protein
VSFVAVLDAAIAGTQRQSPPELVPDAAATAEQRLLHAAAYAGLRRLAGRPLERIESHADTPECPPETLASPRRGCACRTSTAA